MSTLRIIALKHASAASIAKTPSKPRNCSGKYRKSVSSKMNLPLGILPNISFIIGKNSAENEEIIAEDYDEVEDPLQYDFEPVKKPSSNFWIERMKRRIGDTNVSGYKGCPNKYNIFHKCTLYCINKWGDGILEPKRSYLRRRNRLLRKYPLPKNWLEVYDYGW